MMVSSMVHKTQMETVFDKIVVKLTFVPNIPYPKIGIQDMPNNKYSARLIFICGIDFYAE